MVASPSQRFGRPATQYSQVPQKAERQPITWSPGATWRTSAADGLDDAGGLVAEDGRERIRERALEHVEVAVADAGRRRSGRAPRAAPARRSGSPRSGAARRSRASPPPSWGAPSVERPGERQRLEPAQEDHRLPARLARREREVRAAAGTRVPRTRRASRRASQAPRQKWMPAAKATWRSGCRGARRACRDRETAAGRDWPTP